MRRNRRDWYIGFVIWGGCGGGWRVILVVVLERSEKRGKIKVRHFGQMRAAVTGHT